jgi:DHA1 family bicyclomycin/chloramphenicol resistance-like MFS transporter
MSEHVTPTYESIEAGKGSYRFIELAAYILFGVGPLIGNAVLTLLGPISAQFLLDPTVILVAIPAFMFPFAFIQLFSGAISDVYGRVSVIAGGLIVFLAGIALISFSSSIEIFALAHIVSGVGFGFTNPVLLALLSDCSAPEDIPQKMGIASALASVGVGLGPFIAGQMVILGWQYYYLLILSIVFLGLIAVAVAKRPPTQVHGETGISVLLESLSIELRKPVVALMLVTAFLVANAYLGTLVWTSRGLTGAVDETLTGLLLLGAGIFGATAGLLLNPMIKSRGYGSTIALGILSLFATMAIFILIGDITTPSSIPWVGLALILVGWAGGILFPLLITFSQIISPERRGVLAGVLTFAFFLGMALIPTIYEPLFLIGMTPLYMGLLGVSVLLFVFFSVLYRRVEALEAS